MVLDHLAGSGAARVVRGPPNRSRATWWVSHGAAKSRTQPKVMLADRLRIRTNEGSARRAKANRVAPLVRGQNSSG